MILPASRIVPSCTDGYTIYVILQLCTRVFEWVEVMPRRVVRLKDDTLILTREHEREGAHVLT